ncbi:unnamed protein product [Candidula unifasciata]|uniref:Solute carrier family 39 member 8 n=1 Tax=Candidula unifasciata TaxID=100452 RepID=A0A8S3Z0W1_9EUPU|nr:unnamed protein product [Candidula unifasciata]
MLNSGLSLRLLVWLYVTGVVSASVFSNNSDQSQVLEATEGLIQRYAARAYDTSQGLTAEEFTNFLVSATGHTRSHIETVLGTCQDAVNCTKLTQCPGIEEVFLAFTQDTQLKAEGLIHALPVIFNTLTSENCSDPHIHNNTSGLRHRKPTVGQAWGYSIGFTSIVIVISNIGACLGPIMDKRYFKRILQFLVAMGAGSLASTGLLVLIPEAFDIVAFEELQGYVWKSTVAIFSLYVFFCSERILKIFLSKRRKLKQNISLTVEEPSKNGFEDLSLTPLNKNKKEDSHGHSHLSADDDHADRKTLAWMVMAGDVLHNFVDGLSIGAAFTEDIALGISISLAVVCEELPHELADIAILLHSGLSMKKSLFINFLSACVIYLGVILGVMLSSMITEANKWIFAMAGGLFLYVPLVDMLPDMSSHLDKLIAVGSKEARVIAALHACGLVIGTGIIVIIVNVSGYIAAAFT